MYGLKWNNAYGLTRIIELNNEILPNIGFALLKLKKGEIYSSNTDLNEICLVILCGKWKFIIDKSEMEYLCERKSVFNEKAYAFYIPPHTYFKIQALEEGNIAFCESNGNDKVKRKHVFITPNDVKEVSHGCKNFQRTAFEILTDKIDANMLLVGETISEPGNWSSFPPHKHDTANPPYETALEELYFFMFNPPGGFGIQRIYNDDESFDELFLVKDGHIILIPNGYHPVVSAPEYSHYYLWILAGEDRVLRPYLDPHYKWIKC